MGSTNSVRRNYIYNASLQVLTLLVPFITTPYLSRILGADNIGKYSYAASIVSYFIIIATLGTSTYGQRKIAFHRDNIDKMSWFFWNTVLFRTIMTCISLCLYALYLIFFHEANLLTVIISISIFNAILDISWFFQGIENFKKVLRINLIIRIISLVAIFVFVRSKDDTWKYVLILQIAQVVEYCIMWSSIHKFVVVSKKLRPFEDIKDILLIFLPTIAIQIYATIDKSMIRWITGSDYAVGCYEQSEKIAKIAMTVVTSVGAVILPRVANLFKNDDIEHAKEYVYQGFNVVWFIAMPMMFGLIAIAPTFIPLFLGEGFSDSIGLLCILSVLVLVASLAYVIGLSYLIPTNQQNVYTIAISIAAVVNIVMNSILIPKYGAYGAAIASVFAETIGTSTQIMYCIIKKQLEPKRIFASCWKYIVSSLIMYLILKNLNLNISSAVYRLTLQVGMGVLIYFILLMVLKDNFLTSNLKSIINNFWIKGIDK